MRKRKKEHTIETAFHRLRDCQHLLIPMMALVVLVAYIPNGALCIAFNLFIEVVNRVTSRLSLTP